jgi:hypothetical protein
MLSGKASRILAFRLSVFRGASATVAVLVLGCGQARTAGLMPRSDGEMMDVASATGPDGGAADMMDAASATGPDGGAGDGPVIPQPDGGAVSVPAMCQVPTSAAAPYSVKFRFRNRASVPVFRYLGCTSEVEISSCATSYADQLANRDSCPCYCASSGCPVCGQCYDEGTPLAPNAIFEEAWDGLVGVRTTGANGHACNARQAVAAGRYRVRLPIYASAADAKAHAPTVSVATADFELPTAAADGVIEIDIAL